MDDPNLREYDLPVVSGVFKFESITDLTAKRDLITSIKRKMEGGSTR